VDHMHAPVTRATMVNVNHLFFMAILVNQLKGVFLLDGYWEKPVVSGRVIRAVFQHFFDASQHLVGMRQHLGNGVGLDD